MIQHHRFFLILLLLTSLPVTANKSSPHVVVSIKPLYSLVASIMKGVDQPALLISGNASPHHTTLKPSQRKLLADAQLLFWIGPRLESFMPRLLDSLQRDNISIIELDQTEGLLRLPLRHLHEQQQPHDEVHNEKHINALSPMENIDPHLWLHTGNLKIMANEITRQLSQLDPGNRLLYEKNNQQLQQQIAALKLELQQTLAGLDQGFISYHDAYQYFEHEFALHQYGVVSLNENIKPGARHISQLRKTIQQNDIHCLFYDAPTHPPLLNTLLDDLEVKTQAIDASGLLLEASEDSLFTLLRTLGQNFKDCLSSGDPSNK